jgi:hypothetical protein
VRRFADITSDRDLQRALEQVYGNVNNIDLRRRMAEDHVPGSSPDPRNRRQSVRAARRRPLRYTNDASSIAAVRGSSVERGQPGLCHPLNTTITHIQDGVFRARRLGTDTRRWRACRRREHR